MDATTNSIVFTHGGGRFGNQFLNALNLMAFNHEFNDFDVTNLALIPYRNQYEDSLVSLTEAKHSSVNRIWSIMFDLLWAVSPSHIPRFSDFNQTRCHFVHDLAERAPDAQSICAGYTNYDVPGESFQYLRLNEVVETVLDRKSLTVLAGWGARCWPLVKTHENILREALAINSSHRERAHEFIRSLRGDYDRIIGVLIRQGDYRSWHKGDYYFKTSTYEQWIDQYESICNNRVGFVIASDEVQGSHLEKTNYHTATGIEVGSGHYLESFIELSLCDEILTPPSTFSACAGFLNETPIVPLYDGVSANEWERLENHLFDCLNHTHMSESIK